LPSNDLLKVCRPDRVSVVSTRKRCAALSIGVVTYRRAGAIRLSPCPFSLGVLRHNSELDFYAQFWHTGSIGKKISSVPMKPLRWIGPSKDELMDFPKPVMRAIGFALYEAQTGDKPDNAKPRRGFGGAGVLEVIEDHDGNTYRAVYTVKLGDAVYVLHCFQKKSAKGIQTPKHIMELIERRLKLAIQTHAKRSN
jgi:phage-related protein